MSTLFDLSHETPRAVGNVQKGASSKAAGALARGAYGSVRELILAFRPKVDWRPLSRQLAVGPTHGNVVSIDGTQLARQVLVALAKGEPGCPELAELMREARRAFQSVSRRGFDEEGLRSGDSAQAFADGVGALDEVAQCLKAFLNVLDRMALPCGTWSRQFDDDEEQFRTQFHRIYGASL